MLKLILTLLAIALLAPSAMADPKTIEGFAGYQFGMTLERAREARGDAKRVPCEPFDGKVCLGFNDVFYGEPARVIVSFVDDLKPISLIAVFFDRSRRSNAYDDCRNLVDLILRRLQEKYGSTFATANKGLIAWQFPEGASISVLSLCNVPGNETVSVIYRPTSAL